MSPLPVRALPGVGLHTEQVLSGVSQLLVCVLEGGAECEVWGVPHWAGTAILMAAILMRTLGGVSVNLSSIWHATSKAHSSVPRFFSLFSFSLCSVPCQFFLSCSPTHTTTKLGVSTVSDH